MQIVGYAEPDSIVPYRPVSRADRRNLVCISTGLAKGLSQLGFVMRAKSSSSWEFAIGGPRASVFTLECICDFVGTLRIKKTFIYLPIFLPLFLLFSSCQFRLKLNIMGTNCISIEPDVSVMASGIYLAKKIQHECFEYRTYTYISRSFNRLLESSKILRRRWS